MKETHKSSIGKICVILLSSALILSAIFIVPTEVQAATFDNSVSDFKLYPSGCLKSMQISIRGIDSYTYAPAYGKIAIHSQESKYTWTGTHLNIGSSGNWPDSIENDGFIVWGSGDEFLWTDKETHVVAVDFPDQVVNLNNQQTYYVYLWTRQNSEIYTDALIYTFKTKDGALTDSNGNELITTHIHNWNYGANANELKAWCSGGTGTCGYLNEANALTLTLNTTENMDYTGSQYSGASISSAQKTAWTKAGLAVPVIQYAGTGSTSYISSTAAPHNIGSYKATITAGGATAESPFTILRKLTTSASFAADGDNSGTLYNVTTDMKYSINGGSSWEKVPDTITHLMGISADTDIKVFQPGDGVTTSDSDIQTIDITQSAAPTNVSSVNCTTTAQNDGKLINLDSTMEYKKSTDGIYQSIASETITGLSNGDYDIRIRAKDTVLASPAQRVTILQHTCTAQGSWLSDETNHWKLCACGGKVDEASHTGGAADCQKGKICSVCTKEYSNKDAENHTNLVTTDAVSPAHMTVGNIEYYYCSGCNKYFIDSIGSKEIPLTDTVLAKLPEHSIDNTGWHYDETNHWNTCECGEILNEDRHTYKWIIDKEASKVKDGLKHEQCTVCGYKKTAVAIPAAITPNTRDNSNILLWISIMLISILSSITIFFKKSSWRKNIAK